MSPTEIKAVMRDHPVFCVNCVHYLESVLHPVLGITENICGRGNKTTNLVTGKTDTRYNPCHIERSNVIGATCGPLGTHYKART